MRRKDVAKKKVYLQSLKNLIDYHLKLRQAMCRKYPFVCFFDLQQLMVCRQVEMTLYVERYSQWEVALVGEGREYVKLKKYYPFLAEATRTYVLPRKEKEYASRARYYHLFEPYIGKKRSYTISLTFYSDSIFKSLGGGPNKYDEAIAADISKYYRQQNVRGPEAVMVVLMESVFAVIIIRGVTSTFWRRYQKDSAEAQAFFAKATKSLAQEAVEFAFLNQRYPWDRVLLSDFQWEQDVLYMVVLCDGFAWRQIMAAPPLAAEPEK